jgi:hypothetical protein
MRFRDRDNGGVASCRRVYRRVIPGRLRKWIFACLVVAVITLTSYEEYPDPPPVEETLAIIVATESMASYLETTQGMNAQDAVEVSQGLVSMGVNTPSDFLKLVRIVHRADESKPHRHSGAATATAMSTSSDHPDLKHSHVVATTGAKQTEQREQTGKTEETQQRQETGETAEAEEAEETQPNLEADSQLNEDEDAVYDETAARQDKAAEDEEQNYLGHLWNLADRTQKGYLTYGEVRKVMKVAGREVGYEVFKTAMSQIDRDASGDVHFFEFLSWWQSNAQLDPHGAGHDQTDMLGNANDQGENEPPMTYDYEEHSSEKMPNDENNGGHQSPGGIGYAPVNNGGYQSPASDGYGAPTADNINLKTYRGATGSACGNADVTKAAVAELGRRPGSAQGAVVFNVRGGNSKACAAHYKQTKPCCGQIDNGDTQIVAPQYQCTESQPTCKGYVYNEYYGQCTGKVSASDHANTSQRKKALLPTLHQMLLGSDEALTVGKGLLQYEDTFKAKGWTTPSALITLSHSDLTQAGLKSTDISLLQDQVQAFIRLEVAASMPRKPNDSIFCKAKERNGFRLKPYGSTAAASCVAPDELVPPTGTKKPMLAICIPTRSSDDWQSVQDTNLFSVLLPSIGVYSPVNLCTRHCFD